MLDNVMDWLQSCGVAHFIDIRAMVKALVFATVTVSLVRWGVWLAQDRPTDEEKEKKIEAPIQYVSGTIHENDCCGVCNERMWNDKCLELKPASVVQLKCTHCFHRSCYLDKLDPRDEEVLKVISCVIRGRLRPCLQCLEPPTSVSIQPMQKWQTVSFWVLLIDEALDITGPHKYGVSWAEIRKKAREISGLTLEQLQEGDRSSNPEEPPLEDEDLDGPGQFPFIQALRDAGAKKFFWNGVAYRGRGNWCTHLVCDVEKMIFKYSWGIPPFTKCALCNADVVDQATARSCSKCADLIPVMKYWCSEKCFEEGMIDHKDKCDAVCSAFARFNSQRLLELETCMS